MRVLVFLAGLLWAAAAVAQTATIQGNTTIGGQLSVTNTTDATSPVTGAAQIAGGIGIQKSLSVGGAVNIGPNPAANYLATPLYGGTLSSSYLTAVLGSSGTPDTTDNAAIVVQKVTTGAQTGTAPNGTVYISNTKTGSTSGQRAMGLLAEGYDIGGGNGTFVEGGRFHGTLAATATSGAAYGAIALAQNVGGGAWDFLVGAEAAVENSTTDAPATFNSNHFAAGFLATNAQGAGSHIADAGFVVNGSNAKPFRTGFLVGPSAFGGTAVSDAAFRSLGVTAYGLDLSGATNSFAAIELPPQGVIRGKGVGASDLNLMYVPSGSNSLILGTDTNGITLPAVSAPATPGAGFIVLYLDVADGKLKAKASSGIVTVLASP